jgi:hypothetical protein
MYKFLIGALTMVAAVSAHADFIDFPASTTNTGQATKTYGIATFTVTGGTVFQFAPGAIDFVHGGMCGTAFGVCKVDFSLDFSSAVTDLKFASDGFNPGDSTLVTAYNGMAIVASELVGSDKAIDFGALTITRLVFDDSSTDSGFAFGDFNYALATRDPGNDVPEPGSLALLGIGIAGLAAARKRKPA